MDMKTWLEGLGHTDVRPVTLRIGVATFHGCAYRNKNLDFHEAMVLLGDLPACYRRSRKTAFRIAGDTRDWFVSGYSSTDVRSEYQPWGRQFTLHPWNCAEPIDRYEEKPYRRADAVLMTD